MIVHVRPAQGWFCDLRECKFHYYEQGKRWVSITWGLILEAGVHIPPRWQAEIAYLRRRLRRRS